MLRWLAFALLLAVCLASGLGLANGTDICALSGSGASVSVEQPLAVVSAVPIQEARTMRAELSGPFALTGDPPVWKEVQGTLDDLGITVRLNPIDKWEFYEAVATPDHVLTIQTAELQRYANILLTIGVRMEE